jgi:DNA repair ATPase RecN
VADNHIQVSKTHGTLTTTVSAEKLGQGERLRSLASMASGQEDQEVALSFAQSLIDQANQIRSEIGR